MSKSELIVDCRNVDLSFAHRNILTDFNLQICKGDRISFLGPSGCGKSTLLNLISGLVQPTAGRIERSIPTEKISFVFQDASLFPWKTVRENLEIMSVLVNTMRSDLEHFASRIQAVLAQVGLADRKDAFPDELSGGMKMRVALARALLNSPQLLLLDEPFSALDDLTRERLQDDLLKLQRSNASSALVLVTHNIEEAILLTDRILVFAANGVVLKEIQLRKKAPDGDRNKLRESEETQSLRHEIRSLWNKKTLVGEDVNE